MTTDDPGLEVVANLNILIMQSLRTKTHEEVFPTHGADRMNSIIAHNKARVKTLRRIREEFEDEITKVGE